MSALAHASDRPKGYDVSDFLDDGGTVEDLLRLADEAPEWSPPERRSGLVVGREPGLTTAAVGVRIATVRASDLVRKRFPEPRWSVRGIVAEGANLLVGGPKKGKSWLVLGMGVAVAARGKALGKIDVEAGEVLLLSLEDNERRLQERLWRVLQDEPAPAGLHFATEWPRLDQGGAEELDAWLRTHPGVRLVVIDVIARLRPPGNGTGDLYARDYQTMAALKEVADAHRVALIAVHHTRKANADDPFDLISGTNGLAAAADTALVLTRESGRADANVYVRGRDVPEADHALSFDPVSCTWHLLGDAAEYRLTAGRAEVVALLRAGEPMAPKDIAAALGMEAGNARVLLHRMRQAGQLASSGGLYSLPPCNGCNGVTPPVDSRACADAMPPPTVTGTVTPGLTRNAEFPAATPTVTPLHPLQGGHGWEVFEL